MPHSLEFEVSKGSPEDSWREICSLGHKFLVMSCLTGWASNGFLIFQLQCSHLSWTDVTCHNQLCLRIRRCHQRPHDMKFARQVQWVRGVNQQPMALQQGLLLLWLFLFLFRFHHDACRIVSQERWKKKASIKNANTVLYAPDYLLMRSGATDFVN